MESKSQRKRKQPEQTASGQPASYEDVEMTPSEQETSSAGSQERKIFKAKKNTKQSYPTIIEENGEELEFEGSEDEFEEEDVVQREEDEEWEDASSDENQGAATMDEEEKKAETSNVGLGKVVKKEIWNESQEPLKEGEELVFDSSAYEMLHRVKVEWPCLSIDFLLKDRIGASSAPKTQWFPHYLHTLDPNQSRQDKHGIMKHKNDRFPYTSYLVAGSQATKKNENRLYVMKWGGMQKTLHDDDDVRDDSDNEEPDKDPEVKFQTVPHKGCINRVRSMYGTGIVATWNEDGEVGIYDVTQAVDALDQDQNAQQKKNFGGCKLASFKHKDEGYALDWSPSTYGRLAAGSCNAQIWLYQPADEGCSTFVKETQVGLQGHKGSVEDIQFSPSQEQVLASCSTDKTIKLWDLRATQQKPQISFVAHDCDVNVISWNTSSKFLLASGDDKGEFRIWDLRQVSQIQNQQFESITRIRWHTAPITSIQFEPREESVLSVSSADNRLTLWDFSVEVDESQANGENEVPPQLMFLHQGQQNLKELRFHPYYRTMIVTTAEESFNIFRPNLEAEEDEAPVQGPSNVNNANYYIDSEEEEADELKIVKAAKKLNKQRNGKTKDGKRRRMEEDK